jgi:hypothetical protein
MKRHEATLPRWAAFALAAAAALAVLGLATILGKRLGRRKSDGAPADTDLGEPGRNIEQRLDEAVMETFPASDPIATRIE